MWLLIGTNSFLQIRQFLSDTFQQFSVDEITSLLIQNYADGGRTHDILSQRAIHESPMVIDQLSLTAVNSTPMYNYINLEDSDLGGFSPQLFRYALMMTAHHKDDWNDSALAWLRRHDILLLLL